MINKVLSSKKIIYNILSLIKRQLLGVITNVETEKAMVALTFDDGPDPKYTPRLIGILEDFHARATFFMIGRNAVKYPEIIKLIAKNGHAIGNHTWDHPSFPYISGAERRSQIRTCQRALAPYGAKLLRPPYGNQNTWSRIDALLLGYKVVAWNVIANDWLGHDANWIVNEIKDKIQPGNVILFHDSLYDTINYDYCDRTHTLEAVQTLLEYFSGKFQFVTISELLECGYVKKRIWNMKADIEFLNSLESKYGEPRRYS